MKPISDARTCKDGCTYLRGRLHVLAGKEAVHCKDGCSALRERLQCTASEMGKTGTEIASPILDKRTGRRDAPVAPWKYLLCQKEGKSRHCSVIHLYKAKTPILVSELGLVIDEVMNTIMAADAA